MAVATQTASPVQNSTNKSSTRAAQAKSNVSSTSTTKRKHTAAASRTIKPTDATPAKAASIAGESPVNGVTSAYSIMASRIANRVAEMAESLTFVERPRPKEPSFDLEENLGARRRPRKLEMRLAASAPDAVAFSAPFLDNTLQKMLALQNRMLASTADLSRTEGLEEKVVREHAAQSAELSRIIALICAEKARQGA